MPEHDRKLLGFEKAAKKAFAFLGSFGFSEIESLATLIRYKKENVEIVLYHGRRSYEIGVDVLYMEIKYTLGDVLRLVDPEIARRVDGLMASTVEGIAIALEKSAVLMKHYAVAALKGDPRFFSVLEENRKAWTDSYWLNNIAQQVRPQAEEAFRKRNYTKSYELYSRIRGCLSPAELIKLQLAEERRKF